MIEVQFVGRTTQDAFASVPPPDLKLHSGGNYSSSLWLWWNWVLQVLFAFHSFEVEFEDRSSPDLFSPRINKVEHPVA